MVDIKRHEYGQCTILNFKHVVVLKTTTTAIKINPRRDFII